MNLAEAIKGNGTNIGKRGGTYSPHFHVWVKDDRDGYREWVCVVCALSFGVKAIAQGDAVV